MAWAAWAGRAWAGRKAGGLSFRKQMMVKPGKNGRIGRGETGGVEFRERQPAKGGVEFGGCHFLLGSAKVKLQQAFFALRPDNGGLVNELENQHAEATFLLHLASHAIREAFPGQKLSPGKFKKASELGTRLPTGNDNPLRQTHHADANAATRGAHRTKAVAIRAGQNFPASDGLLYPITSPDAASRRPGLRRPWTGFW